MNSNIVIVEHEEKTESEGVVHSTYGVGASGVGFKQDKDVYYALTAYHVVKNYSNAEYFIIPYGAPTYSEYREQSEVHVPNEEYYGQFEKATVVFADEKYDLAVISFKSEKILVTIEGNTVVGTEELMQHLLPLKGKPQNISAINAAMEKINECYYSKGYILSKIDSIYDDPDGTLNLLITEGKKYKECSR